MKGHSIQIPLISNTLNFVFNYNSKESITQFQRRVFQKKKSKEERKQKEHKEEG